MKTWQLILFWSVLTLASTSVIFLGIRYQQAESYFIEKTAPPIIRAAIVASVEQCDFENIRRTNIAVLKTMSDTKFKREYGNVWSQIELLDLQPQAAKLGLKKKLYRLQAVAILENITQEKAAASARSIPDASWAKLLRQNFFRPAAEKPSSVETLHRSLDQLNQVFEKLRKGE